jgi:hypothetical protein
MSARPSYQFYVGAIWGVALVEFSGPPYGWAGLPFDGFVIGMAYLLDWALTAWWKRRKARHARVEDAKRA